MVDVVADKVILELEAKIDAYRADVERARKEFTKAMDDMQGAAGRTERAVHDSMGRLGRSMYEAFSIGTAMRQILAALTVEKLVTSVAGAVSQIADIKEYANRIGITTTTMQAMERQAALTGVSVEELQMALQRIAAQSQETGSYIQKLFAANNIKVSEESETNIRNFLDLVKNAGTAGERLALITKGTGIRGSFGLVEAFSQGSAAIDRTFKEMEASGRAHSDAQINEAHHIRDKYREYMNDIALYWESAVVEMMHWTQLFEDSSVAGLNRAQERLKEHTRDASIAASIAGGIPVVGGIAAPIVSWTQWLASRDQGRISEATKAIRNSGRDELHKDPFDTGGFGSQSANSRTNLPGGDDTLTKERKALNDAIQNTIKATESEIAALKEQMEAYGKSAYEIARAKKERELLDQLEAAHRQHGGAVTSDELAKVQQLADAYGRVTQALTDQERELKNLKDVADTVFGDIESAIDKMIDTGKFSFKDFVGSVLRDLAKLGVHKLLDQGENGVPGTSNTGILGWVSSLFNGAGPAASVFKSNAVGSAGQFGTPAAPSPIAPIEAVTSAVLPALKDQSRLEQVISTEALPPLANPIGAGLSGPQAGVGGIPLLNMIAQREGTANQSNSGYDTTLGYGRFLPGGDEGRNLSTLKLDQVEQLQNVILGQTSRLPKSDPLYNSSAVGRYQFTRSTLNDLKRQTGLTGDETFSPALQDQLALKLAMDRGSARGITGLRDTWPSLHSASDADVGSAFQATSQQLQAGSAKLADSLKNVANTAAQGAQGFQGTFPKALESVVQAVSGGGSPGGGMGGIVGAIFGSFGSVGASAEHSMPFGGSMAEGGPMHPGRAYLIGENGPEMVRVHAPSHVTSAGGGNKRQGVVILPSKYFDAHVVDISGEGDLHTLSAARRRFPDVQGQYEKLGTTGR